MTPLSKRRLTLIGSAALLAVALVFVALRAGPWAPMRVTVTQAVQGTIQPAVFGIGTVEARRNWMIGPTAAGRVLNVQVDVGDSVKAGQVLAEMDPVDLNQRIASVAAAHQKALSAQTAAAAQQADAFARRALASANARRNQELADQHFISPVALDARLQEKRSADAALQAAAANLQGAGQDVIRLAADRAALQQQRHSVRLIAPADGVVTAREAEAGSTVVAGQAVLRLIDPASLWIRLRVDQGRSAGLASGLKAAIVLRSQSRTPLPGQVARVELLADSITEERIAQVAFDRMPAGVSVGEMAEVTLTLSAIADAILVPNASIQRQGNATGVWRIASGKLVFAPVRVGATSLDGQVQVWDGVQAGDRIVAYSHKALVGGSRVRVVEALLPTPPTAEPSR